ncbi:MAG TPA: ATP-binding protein [Polyangiales bacterium]|nr:ATP-binding protein [Polyangiales bacterium]
MPPDDAGDRIRQLEGRLSVISSSVRAFAEATTDYSMLLDLVARKLADTLKDGCVLRLLEDGALLAPVAMHLPFERYVNDPVAIERVRAHVARPQPLSAQGGAPRMMETGEPVLMARIDMAEMRKTTAPEIVDAYETIGIHSALLVPMRARGESLGLLSLVRFHPQSPAFTEADRDLAQALADNAALAVSNARLFQSALQSLSERERAEAQLRKTEEQLRHAQKMEAVGRLAGSVAHDFNNLLSVILGHGLLLLNDIQQSDPMREDISAMITAGERAADLTRQLLAFSRQQVLAPRVIDLNTSVRAAEKILRRLIGEDIELIVRCPRRLSSVLADPGQIDQVIMNLAINARDAMPSGGKITIETKDVTLDDPYASEHIDVEPGPYVMLAISDTGAGMTKDVQARIFEPFFTTKEAGKGTGLGLSTVFGIVKQSGGHIWVYSEPDQGATFKVYLPVTQKARDSEFPPEKPQSLHGNETVLLVEDQDEVRAVALQILRRYGYHVIEARNAGEALLYCEQHPLTIHLLLSDVVMPQMNGRKLADRLYQIRPHMKVLFMSGYTENAIVHHGILDPGIEYVQKPLLPETLARRVREVLEGPPKP